MSDSHAELVQDAIAEALALLLDLEHAMIAGRAYEAGVRTQEVRQLLVGLSVKIRGGEARANGAQDASRPGIATSLRGEHVKL